MLSYLIFFIILQIEFNSAQFFFPLGYNPNKCQIAYTGQQGSCKKFSRCKQAQSYLQYYQIYPNICYYEGDEPVVCCEKAKKGGQHLGQRLAEGLRTDRLSERKCIDEYIPKVTSFIVGGKKTGPDEFEFMAALGWRRTDGKVDWRCGAFLVSRNFALTSAHCTSLSGRSPDVVRIGGRSLKRTGGQDTTIQAIYVYPHYNTAYNYHDLAILKLAGRSRQRPACLWSKNKFNQKDVTAIGYGHTQFGGKVTPDLQKVQLDIIGNPKCKSFYPKQKQLPNGIVDSLICAGSSGGGRDTCQGDSGGPILVKVQNRVEIPYVVGITSFGQVCGSLSPSVYLRVTPYLDWIESIVWPKANG